MNFDLSKKNLYYYLPDSELEELDEAEDFGAGALAAAAEAAGDVFFLEATVAEAGGVCFWECLPFILSSIFISATENSFIAAWKKKEK